MKAEAIRALLDSPLLPELLEEGQRALTRERVLREKFYRDITPEQKWEFISGEVIMHSPALDRHLTATHNLFSVLLTYVRVRGQGLVRTEKAMVSFPRNDYEPDVIYFSAQKAALVTPDTLRYPVPDLIVEVLSPSTEARDRGVKFQDYAVHGVQEYWIVDPAAETVELYQLAGETYPPTAKLRDGVVASRLLPGFQIPVRAIFDEAENFAALRKILAGE